MAKMGLQLTGKPPNMGLGSRERSREKNSQRILMARAVVSVGFPAPWLFFLMALIASQMKLCHNSVFVQHSSWL